VTKQQKRWLKNRRIAVRSAAAALAGGNFGRDDMWALAVFFDRYCQVGADKTRKDFGPKRPKKATVLRLVTK
jgi:hypothetical protein